MKNFEETLSDKSGIALSQYAFEYGFANLVEKISTLQTVEPTNPEIESKGKALSIGDRIVTLKSDCDYFNEGDHAIILSINKGDVCADFNGQGNCFVKGDGEWLVSYENFKLADEPKEEIEEKPILKIGAQILIENYSGSFFFNGDIARVTRIHDNYIVADFNRQNNSRVIGRGVWNINNANFSVLPEPEKEYEEFMGHKIDREKKLEVGDKVIALEANGHCFEKGDIGVFGFWEGNGAPYVDFNNQGNKNVCGAGNWLFKEGDIAFIVE